MNEVIFEQVTVRRGERDVLRNVSFTARAGQVTAVLGPNGSGKSTLLAAAANDVPLDAGSIRIGDTDVTKVAPLAAARARAVLTQQHDVAFDVHADALVALARQPWRGVTSRIRDSEIVATAMQDTDALEFSGRGVLALSGGERSRVQLARVLAQTTPVLLLDEPTAALDLKHQALALSCARAAAAEGVAVIVVLHDLDAAFAVADRIVVLDRGEIAANGAPDEIAADSLTRVYGHPVHILRHPVTNRLLVVPLRGAIEAREGMTP